MLYDCLTTASMSMLATMLHEFLPNPISKQNKTKQTINWMYGDTLTSDHRLNHSIHDVTAKKHAKSSQKQCISIFGLTANIKSKKILGDRWMPHCRIPCQFVQQTCRKSEILTRSNHCVTLVIASFVPHLFESSCICQERTCTSKVANNMMKNWV